MNAPEHSLGRGAPALAEGARDGGVGGAPGGAESGWFTPFETPQYQAFLSLTPPNGYFAF
jgi:hypothetical protein